MCQLSELLKVGFERCFCRRDIGDLPQVDLADLVKTKTRYQHVVEHAQSNPTRHFLCEFG